MKAQMKAIMASAVVIALCLAAVGGVTYSWFSDIEQSSVEVSSAQFDMETTVGTPEIITGLAVATTVTPMDEYQFAVEITNLAANVNISIPYTIAYKSTIDVVYKTSFTVISSNLTSYDEENIFINNIPINSTATTLIGPSEASASTDKDNYRSASYTTLSTLPITITTPTTYGDTPDAGWSPNDAKSFKIIIKTEMYQGDYPTNTLVNGEAKISSNKIVQGDAFKDPNDRDAKAVETIVDLSSVSSVTGTINGASTNVDVSDLSIKVESKSDNNGFNTGVGTIGLTLFNGSNPVEGARFGSEKVTVTATIENVTTNPGIVQVFYKAGDTIEPIETNSYVYDSTNNTLTVTFKTDHFSNFTVVSAVAEVEGKYYASLEDAIDSIPPSTEGELLPEQTITILSDINYAYVQSSKLIISKDVTIIGNGYTISGRPVYVNPDVNVTFENVCFKNPGNSNESCVYASNFEKRIEFNGCSFSDAQWDSIQITPESGSTIVIQDCTFSLTQSTGPTNKNRFIHIEAETNSNANVEIQILNNKFGTTESFSQNLSNSIIDLDYINVEKVLAGRNEFLPGGYVNDIYICGTSVNRTIENDDAHDWFSGPDSYVVLTDDSLNNLIRGCVNGNITITIPSNGSICLQNGIANEGSNSRNITFIGNGTQTVDVITKTVSAEGGQLNYQRGSTFTFENLTIKAGEGSFDGIVCDGLKFINCTITGKLTLFGKATFTECTFENNMANQYSIWTWGGTDVTFEDCTFNTNGKAILLYGGASGSQPTNLTVKDCTFNDRNNGAAEKAAIEIGDDYNATYTLTIINATVNGFAPGINTNSTLWANKNSMDADHLSVTIDGVPQTL